MEFLRSLAVGGVVQPEPGETQAGLAQIGRDGLLGEHLGFYSQQNVAHALMRTVLSIFVCFVHRALRILNEITPAQNRSSAHACSKWRHGLKPQFDQNCSLSTRRLT